MNSFLYSYTEELSEKWSEINLLIDKARVYQESDEEFHKVLCRSASVLITAQLEGFTKNMLRSVIYDLNRNLSFEEFSLPIKRTYCQKYIPLIEGLNNKRYNNQINKLISKFDEINCNIEHEPFFISKNKNPSPNLINTVFKNLGVKNIFYCLNESIYDVVFSSSKNELEQILIELNNHVLQEVKNFPYSPVIDESMLEVKTTNGRTLWEEFLDDINQRRHAIAHGNEYSNISSVQELEKDKLKVQIFEFTSLRILVKYLKTNGQD